MKNSTYTTALKNLDLELKALLEEDLKRFQVSKSKNNRATSQPLAA